MGHIGVGNFVFINETMNINVYLDILKTNLASCAEKLGILDIFQFYQDNDPNHKAWLVRKGVLFNCPKVLETPPQRPDINPFEHVWAYLEDKIRKNTK